LITVFSSIENGIYTSITASVALLLIRLARPRGQFLGKISLETDSSDEKEKRDIFVPIKQNGINNPLIKVSPPAPGILIYRFEESYLYPNCSIVNSALVDYVKENMRRGKDITAVKLRDRPWNDNSPRRNSAQEQSINEKKPWLHAIILDFSPV
jgi:sodium-independent sulfate anion transporter 11